MAEVELLWWEGCPSTERAREEIRVAMRAAGLDPAERRERETETDAPAASRRFVGSPTIRVDGRDVQPPPEGEPSGLTCRVYRWRDGRFSPTPDPADLRAALEEAARS
jgi:hypothetical protein